MLLDNCSTEMNTAFTLHKDTKRFSPKVIGDFLGEDIYAYRNDPSLLEEKILILKNVDFHLSNDSRLIASMQHHPNKEISEDGPLNADTQITDQERRNADHTSSMQQHTESQIGEGDCRKTN